MEAANTIKADILRSFPPVDAAAADRMLQEELQKHTEKIIVLDDDPTGVQTVHDISVYTNWDEQSIRQGFEEKERLFYILTNSRGMTASQTEHVHRSIARTIAKVARELGKDFFIISRSDSTLRGHYPLETQVLRQELEQETGKPIDGEILCPFFKEGGRFTIGNVHYVKYGDQLVPAAETEFAKDPTFGYRSSDLRDYIEEKTKGAFHREDVTCISLDDLRSLNFEGIEAQLSRVSNFNKVIVNAIDSVDIKIFTIALYHVLDRGKRFMFRTAAALVKEMGGISDQPLLTRAQMISSENPNGGVIIIGSHTHKTTQQLEALKELKQIRFIEFNSDLVLDPDRFKRETERVTEEIEETIRSGQTAAAYTRRQLLTVENDTKEKALLRSIQISNAVQALVGNLKTVPSFVIAKGGITSSDIGTKALKVRRARVMGQIQPGIPVWQTGPESRFPGIPYVIFPGNVGDTSTLRDAAAILMEKA